ncbi:MAG: SoxR reducing system RseC family protein [Woeseia sp.]
MRESSTDPGLITRIENGWMYVKVPVGLGCNACPTKSACTFSGPDRAYRTFRIRHIAGCQVGDRVLVQVPGRVLGITALVMIVLPVVMILAGYNLLVCCMRFPYATLLLWLIGTALWIAAIYGANYWMEHGIRFQERVWPVAELLHEAGESARSDSEDPE